MEPLVAQHHDFISSSSPQDERDFDPVKTIDTTTSDHPHTTSPHTTARNLEPRALAQTPLNTRPSSPVTSPPYWAFAHARTFSNISSDTIPHGGITLKDNEETNGAHETNPAICWARGVKIDDYIIVNGSLPGIGAFVVWNITIETANGQKFVVRKRYSEFDDLRERLLMTFPLSEGAMPPLPPKGVVSKFRPKFLEHRRIRLAYFLHCILLNPEFASSPVLKEFLFES